LLKIKLLGTIRLKKVKVYAFHGCLVEEGKIGSDYEVNLVVKASLLKASKTDMLAETVDYVHLNKIVKEEMAIRSKLLEHVGRRIVERILTDLPMVSEATVTVSKINPPIGGDVAEVCVTINSKR